MQFSLGEMVTCTDRPGNLNIYPRMIGTILSKKEIGGTISAGKCMTRYAYTIKFPLKNDETGPLDNPIKWMFVDGVPDNCLGFVSGMEDDFNKYDPKVIEWVAKRNSRLIKEYYTENTMDGFTMSSRLFPAEAIKKMHDGLEEGLRKFREGLNAKPSYEIKTYVDPPSLYPDVFNFNFDFSKAAEIWNFIKTKERKDETMIVMPIPVKIIYNHPATTVIWSDKTKTTVKCSEDQEFSEYYGYLAALAKKIYKTNGTIERLIRDKREYGKQHEFRKNAKLIDTYAVSSESVADDAHRTYTGSMAEIRPKDSSTATDVE